MGGGCPLKKPQEQPESSCAPALVLRKQRYYSKLFPVMRFRAVAETFAKSDPLWMKKISKKELDLETMSTFLEWVALYFLYLFSDHIKLDIKLDTKQDPAAEAKIVGDLQELLQDIEAAKSNLKKKLKADGNKTSQIRKQLKQKVAGGKRFRQFIAKCLLTIFNFLNNHYGGSSKDLTLLISFIVAVEESLLDEYYKLLQKKQQQETYRARKRAIFWLKDDQYLTDEQFIQTMHFISQRPEHARSFIDFSRQSLPNALNEVIRSE